MIVDLGAFGRPCALLLGGGLVVLVVLSAVLAPLLAPADPLDADIQFRLHRPTWAPDDGRRFPIGAYAQGRDALSRILCDGLRPCRSSRDRAGRRYNRRAGVTRAIQANERMGRFARWRRALLVVDRHPLDVRLAVRGTVGLMVPLLLGEALGSPDLSVVALAAFLLTWGDLTEDHGWLRRLIAASVGAGTAVAAGTLAGGHALAAAGAMLLCGVAIGLAGAWGAAAAAMALPVAWMFLELGLSGARHGPAEAAWRGGLVLAGGGWAIALAWASQGIRPDRPLAVATALCFARLADYLDAALAEDRAPTGGRSATAVPVDGYAPSRETAVRAPIAQARALAVELGRRRMFTTARQHRMVILVELADQVFALGAVLAEMRRPAGPPARGDSVDHPPGATAGDVLANGAQAVDRLLRGHASRDAIEAVAAELRRLVGEPGTRGGAPVDPAEPVVAPADGDSRPTSGPPAGSASNGTAGAGGSTPPFGDDPSAEIRARAAAMLIHAIELASGPGEPAAAEPLQELGEAAGGPGADGTPASEPTAAAASRDSRAAEDATAAIPAAPPSPALHTCRPWVRSLASWLTPLRSCLDRRSVVGRHALRFGLVTAVGVGVERALQVPFGYWIPLTMTVVLKPYAGSTLTRAGQRVLGTLAGVITGVLLLKLFTAPVAWIVLAGAAFLAAIAVMPLNYTLVVFCLSMGIVPFEAMLGGPDSQTGWQVGMLRAVNTCVGGALALAGGYLLWPSFERRSLPAMLSAALASTAAYADDVLRVVGALPTSTALIEAAHRQAGIDNTNLQATLQRVFVEPGERPERLEAALLAVVALERLLGTLIALWRLGAGASPPPGWAHFHAGARGALADLAGALDSRTPPAPLPPLPLTAHQVGSRMRARGGRHDVPLAHEIERLAWQIVGLRIAVARLVDTSSGG